MKPLDPAVLPYLRPARGHLAAAVLLGCLNGGLVVALAFALTSALVAAIDGDDLTEPLGVLLAVVVARALVVWTGDRLAHSAADRVAARLRRAILAHAAEIIAGGRAGERRTGGTATLATRGVAAIEPYLTRYLPAVVLGIVLPPLTVLAIASQDLASALVVLLTLPLVPVFATLVGWATRDRAQRQWRTMAALAGHFADVVRGLPTLVAFRRADAQRERIAEISDRHRVATLRTLRLAFASSAVLELVATISVALVAVLVGLRLATGGLDLSTALVVLLLAPEAYWPLRRVGAEFHAAAEGTAAFADADALLATPTGAAGGSALPGDVWDAALRVEDVSVTYPGRAVAALAPTSFIVRPGEVVAVTGPSGCGKSTLLTLLHGLLAPDRGRVTIGGAPLTDLDQAWWRAQVSWVPQRPWLGAGTVGDNVRLSTPVASDARVWSALEVVGLAEIVRSLPQGLDTPVGDDASFVSAGQRARLALTRALVDTRPVILLDEPTAHLDAESEAGMLAAVRRLAGRSIVVVVTHRRAVMACADHVIALEPAREAV